MSHGIMASYIGIAMELRRSEPYTVTELLYREYLLYFCRIVYLDSGPKKL